MWILKYYRYHSLEEYEADDKEEALGVAIYGEDDGKFFVHEILSPDGKVFMDRKQFEEYCRSQP